MKRYLKALIISGLAWGSGMFGLMTAEFINPFQTGIQPIQKLLLCSIGGLVFGIFIALILFVFDRKRKKDNIDISQDELRPTKSFVVDLSISKANKLVLESLSVLNKPQIKSNTDNKLIVKTGVNKRTFGEVVSILLEESDEKSTLIQISSRPKSKYTLIDYGMNSDNVRNLVSAISKS